MHATKKETPVSEFLTPQLPEKEFKKVERKNLEGKKKRIKGIHIKKISLFFTLKGVGEEIQKESVCQGN